MKKKEKRKILEKCLVCKNQKAVSLETLAEVLGVNPLSEEDKYRIVEERKK